MGLAQANQATMGDRHPLAQGGGAEVLPLAQGRSHLDAGQTMPALHVLANLVEQRRGAAHFQVEEDVLRQQNVRKRDHDSFRAHAQKFRLSDSTVTPRPASRLRDPLPVPSLAMLLLKQ